ncbi:MAG: DNA-processing protein DprA, partial [Bacteroidia bacterium]|nr:DNA-processing protein DprA [Bacteroidia bacterium]
MDENRLYLLALHFVPGVGNQLIRQLISYCGSAEQVFNARHAQLLRIPGIGEVTARSIKSAVPIQMAEDEVRLADKCGASLLFYLDDQYPSRLKDVGDAPTLLYVRGTAALNDARVVAIVGTRHATDYGKFCVEEIVSGLVPYGVTIVSGLAYGIDIHAHKMALSHGLRTHAVLGSGVDVIYPHVHRDTAVRMLGTGACSPKARWHQAGA